MGENGEKIWVKFLRNHWKIFAAMVIVAIIAFIGAIYVFLWFVEGAQPNLVPIYLDQWSMGHVVTFILHFIFWEAIFIGIPVLVAVVLFWQLWWNKIPEEERKEYKKKHLFFGKHSKRSDSGGFITFLINIGFVVKVYLDGNWDKPFATWKFDYLVYSYLWILVIFAIIIGIPIALGGIWWIRNEMKK